MISPAGRVDLVLRASRRALVVERQELSQNVESLARIAYLAPWVGIFGTVIGIFGSFPGSVGEKSALLAMTASLLSNSGWFTVGGLFVGIIAVWLRTFLLSRVDDFSVEMESAALDLANQLVLMRGSLRTSGTRNVQEPPLFKASFQREDGIKPTPFDGWSD